jgi:3-dehydroquinate synthase
MSKPNIILTGFMATGKTSVGRLLAEHLGYEFIDTDDLIVTRSGKSVAEIFRDQGESAFRAMEAQVARELGGRDGLVISTGGRLMLDADNAAALSRSGRVFCLVATPEEILDRVGQDTGHRRPLLEVPNPLQRVVELLQTRKDQYERFPQLITSDKTVAEVTSYLTGLLQADPDLRLPVTASSSRYEYIVGAGVLPFIRQLANIKGTMAIVTDSQVGPLYAQQCAPVQTVITIPAGGQHKNLESVGQIVDRLVDAGVDRDGTIIALGGAVISELAGFVAATYMRGVDCVQCPTSLLAMVDTSVGGKTGIDTPKGKNLLGVFKQPKAVIVDVATLQSLPAREFAAGMAEVVKHGLIAETDLLTRIENTPWPLEPGMLHARMAQLQALVAQSIQIKIRIVQEDPFDRGRRALLNLGHTFAHAIEHASGFRLRHGEAVAIGLAAAADLSLRLGFCTEALRRRVETVLGIVGLPTRLPAAIDRRLLLAAMDSDKKRSARKLRFVLLRDIGDAFVTEAVPGAALEATLDALAQPPAASTASSEPRVSSLPRRDDHDV